MTETAPASQASSGKAAPELVVAIVNYGTPELVIDCLASLAEHRAECPGMAVVVADNASPDRSAEQIAHAIAENGWGGWVRLSVMPRNGGFGYANNAIIRDYLSAGHAPKYFWLLNSDTVVRPGAIRALLDFMERHPKVGMAGSRLEDPDGTVQHSAFQFPSVAAEFEASVRLGVVTKLLNRWRVAPPITDVNTRYDWLSGASLMIRTEVLQQGEIFDERYFLYYEEVDLCLRMHRQGWQCWYVPASRVIHLVGKSTGVTERGIRPRRRAPYWFESRRYYYIKHHGRLYATMADLALAAGTLVALVRSGLGGRPALCPERFLSDLARHTAILHPSPVEANR
jgi:N-acetylglucosaminyl-diphospho-decaprenol L-rhamnosyltransferase